MTNDLVKRLTIKAGVMEMGEKISWGSDTSLMREAADRIEELEAKLDLSEGALDVASRSWGECQRMLEQTEAKLSRAVEGLQHYACDCVISCEQLNGSCGDMARTTLAELKGEDRG